MVCHLLNGLSVDPTSLDNFYLIFNFFGGGESDHMVASENSDGTDYPLLFQGSRFRPGFETEMALTTFMDDL